MAGDRIHTQVDYFYFGTNANNTGASGINSLLTNLATSIIASGQVAPLLKDGAAAITSALNGNTGFVSLLNTPNDVSGSNQAPKAYLNVLFFDAQFKPDNNATVVVPVSYSPAVKGTISRVLANAITARQNGYVYIYFSNESDDIVYYDNFMVTHELGPIREETHYYPFGLTMAGISSRAIGKLENKYKFNGIEQSNEFDINMYDAFYRNFDPQLGRFWQIDTKPNDMISPYAGMANNPVRYSDPLGDTVTLFRPDGTFWKSHDDGKKEWSGTMYPRSTVTSSYEKDGVQYEVRSYSEGVNFQFNDAAVDVQAIKNGEITNVAIATDGMVNNEMEKSGVNNVKSG